MTRRSDERALLEVIRRREVLSVPLLRIENGHFSYVDVHASSSSFSNLPNPSPPPPRRRAEDEATRDEHRAEPPKEAPPGITAGRARISLKNLVRRRNRGERCQPSAPARPRTRAPAGGRVRAHGAPRVHAQRRTRRRRDGARPPRCSREPAPPPPRLPPLGREHLALAPSDDHDGPEFRFLLALLPEHEREECLRFRFMDDKKRALVSRLMQRAAACARGGACRTRTSCFAARRAKSPSSPGRRWRDSTPPRAASRPRQLQLQRLARGRVRGAGLEPVAIVGVDVAAPGQLRDRNRRGAARSVEEIVNARPGHFERGGDARDFARRRGHDGGGEGRRRSADTGAARRR